MKGKKMSERKTREAGVPAMVSEEALRFDGTRLGLRDYAADEVRSFQKPRDGFIPVVEGVIETLPGFEDRLRIKGVDAVSIAKNLERYQELTAALARAEKITEIVSETRLAVGDAILGDVYRVYRLAKAIGRDDAEIRGAFDFVREWLSVGPRPEKEPSNPTPPTR